MACGSVLSPPLPSQFELPIIFLHALEAQEGARTLSSDLFLHLYVLYRDRRNWCNVLGPLLCFAQVQVSPPPPVRFHLIAKNCPSAGEQGG